jgi:hypothetical protein
MKSLLAKLVFILLVIVLAIGYGNGWAADWKEFAEATTGVFRYDAASLSSPSGGFVRVWINHVTRNETNLVEFNCKDRSYQVLDVVQWDEAYHIKSRESYYDNPTPNWLNISPKSVPESLYKIVCP